MSKTLKLMEECDLPSVERMVAEALPDRTIECAIDQQHETRMLLTLETDIPASEIGEEYRKSVAPLLAGLEDELGEFDFDMWALCACGQRAMPMIDDDPEHDMCLCGECLDRSIDEHRDSPRNTCPVCEKGFDGFENPGWRVNCSAKFVSEEDGAKPEMDIDTMPSISVHADTDRCDCCSRECALVQFRKWLSEVESHSVAKEAGP